MQLQLPTDWTPGPSQFKDWCAQWFGPDSDDDYLMRAVHALLQTAKECKPLTDEQIEALPVWGHFVGLHPETRKEIARAIESAHGIK